MNLCVVFTLTLVLALFRLLFIAFCPHPQVVFYIPTAIKLAPRNVMIIYELCLLFSFRTLVYKKFLSHGEDVSSSVVRRSCFQLIVYLTVVECKNELIKTDRNATDSSRKDN